MKYLKTFEANSNRDLEYDIKDIFLSEVEDEDKFKVSIQHIPYKFFNDSEGYKLSISLSNINEYEYRIGEIKDFLLRLKDYFDNKSLNHSKMKILINDDSHRVDYVSIDFTEADIDKTDKWYNMIDAPGLNEIFIDIA